MISEGYFAQHELLHAMLEAALSGLRSFAGLHDPALLAGYRLAFRELGLTIGLHAAARLQRLLEEEPARFANRDRLSAVLAKLHRYDPLVDAIEEFWLSGANREAATWTEHGDINMIMLATSLAPDGFLRIYER